MIKRTYTWYIEPLDSHTNGVIGQQLAELAEESFCPKIICGDKKQHDLWRCSYEFVLSLINSKDSLGLKFKVWGSTGRYGKIVKKTFLFSFKWRNKKKTKTAL